MMSASHSDQDTASPAAMNRLAAPIATAVLLAFVASFVDTVGFVALFSLFTAHVTGNFVVIAATLAGNGAGVTTKLLALPVFILAVGAAQGLVLLQPERPRRVALELLVMQVLLLICFLALGRAANPIAAADAPLAMSAGLAGVAAMGLQNALARTPLFGALSPTTVMTGNVTQATMDLVSLVVGPLRGRREAGVRLRKTWPLILAFTLGAGAAAGLFAVLNFWCLLAPILLLALIVGLVSKTT
jgi:uncharacterized membrane protein YoaK (UPF0700 family)